MPKRTIDENQPEMLIEIAMRRVEIEQELLGNIQIKLRAARDGKASSPDKADLRERLDLIAQAHRRSGAAIAAVSKAVMQSAVPRPDQPAKPVEVAPKATP